MLFGDLLTWWMMDTADGAEDKPRRNKIRSCRKKQMDIQATETETDQSSEQLLEPHVKCWVSLTSLVGGNVDRRIVW